MRWDGMGCKSYGKRLLLLLVLWFFGAGAAASVLPRFRPLSPRSTPRPRCPYICSVQMARLCG